MADRIALNRSNSFSRSEASDAGSSSSKWEQDDPVAVSTPVAKPGSPTQLLALALPPSSPPHPIAHTLPTVTGSGPQPGTSNPTVTSRVQPVSRPAVELHAGVLAINVIDYDNTNIRNLLVANPGIHSVLIQPGFVLHSIIDLFGQFATISTLATLKFDFRVNRGNYPEILSDLDMECCNAIGYLLASNSSITKLDFSNQRIFVNLLDNIALGLSRQTTLKVLDLTGERLAPRNLDMNSPKFMGKMGDGIAAILSMGSGLSSLLASHQWIDDEDAMLIAGALKKNTGLTTLVLGNNKLEEKGSRAIFDAIRKNKKTALTKLDLSGCVINGSAAKSLTGLLKKNTSLVDIAIGTVPDTECLKAIYDGLAKNKSLLYLQFSSMPNPDEKFQKIWLQIDAHLKERKIAAAGQPAAMAIANTASSTSATTHTSNPKSDKGPG